VLQPDGFLRDARRAAVRAGSCSRVAPQAVTRAVAVQVSAHAQEVPAATLSLASPSAVPGEIRSSASPSAALAAAQFSVSLSAMPDAVRCGVPAQAGFHPGEVSVETRSADALQVSTPDIGSALFWSPARAFRVLTESPVARVLGSHLLFPVDARCFRFDCFPPDLHSLHRLPASLRQLYEDVRCSPSHTIHDQHVPPGSAAVAPVLAPYVGLSFLAARSVLDRDGFRQGRRCMQCACH